jgi:hypothetical protein
MARRMKQATARKGKSTARGNLGGASKSARGKSAKQTAANAMPKKRFAKPKPKRAGAKKVARKKVRPTKPPITPVVETIITDLVEEPVPGVITIAEFEDTVVREQGEGRETPEETPPESEER